MTVNKFKRQKNHTGDALSDLCGHDSNDITYRGNDKTVFSWFSFFIIIILVVNTRLVSVVRRQTDVKRQS